MIIGFLTNVFENTLTAETFSTKHKISLTEVSKYYLHSKNKSLYINKSSPEIHLNHIRPFLFVINFRVPRWF